MLVLKFVAASLRTVMLMVVLVLMPMSWCEPYLRLVLTLSGRP